MIREYLKPSSVAEALDMKKNTSGAYFLGGGTKLNKLGEDFNAEVYISLEKLGLKAINLEGKEVRIGAGVTVQQLIDSPDIPEFLKNSASGEANRNLRNASTVGGEVAYGHSCSTLVAGLIAMDADLETSGGRVSLYEYVKNKNADLILNIVLKQSDSCLYQRDQRVTANSRPELTMAVSVVKNSGKVTSAIVVMGGLTDKPVRLGGIEAKLMSGAVKSADAVQDAVQDEIVPYTEKRERGTYLNYIGAVLAADCVGHCMR